MRNIYDYSLLIATTFGANIIVVSPLMAQSLGSFATVPTGDEIVSQTAKPNAQKDSVDGLTFYPSPVMTSVQKTLEISKSQPKIVNPKILPATNNKVVLKPVEAKITPPLVMFYNHQNENVPAPQNIATITNSAPIQNVTDSTPKVAILSNPISPSSAKKQTYILEDINNKWEDINNKWKVLNQRPQTPEEYAVRGPLKAIYQDTKSAIAHDVPQALANSMPWVDTNRKQENFESVLDRVTDNLNRASAADPEWAYSAQGEIRELARKLDTLPNPPQYRSEMLYSNYDPKQDEVASDSNYVKRPVWPGANSSTSNKNEKEEKPFSLKNNY